MKPQDYLLSNIIQINQLLREIKNVAVIGIRSEQYPDKAAYYVPEALQRQGLKIFPVSNFANENDYILGEKINSQLTEIKEEIDLVNIFRKSSDVPKHLDEILEKKPKAVWMQLGINNNEVAKTLIKNNIYVIQDRCLMVDYLQFIKQN